GREKVDRQFSSGRAGHRPGLTGRATPRAGACSVRIQHEVTSLLRSRGSELGPAVDARSVSRPATHPVRAQVGCGSTRPTEDATRHQSAWAEPGGPVNCRCLEARTGGATCDETVMDGALVIRSKHSGAVPIGS